MAKFNRKCFYCGEPYYCCSSCVSINSWKNTYCSTDCFIKSQEDNTADVIKPIVIDKGDVYMKAAIKKNGKTINITGYDLELGKFDCSDNKTRILDDFEYFIVTPDEMKELTVKKDKIESEPVKKNTRGSSKGKVERTVIDLPRR